MGYIRRKERYSFSKINTFIQCPYKYYVQYVLGHFVDTSNINTFFGSLVHKIEERIGLALKNGDPIDYEALKKDFMDYNIPKTSKFDTGGDIYGVNVLKTMFPDDFYKIDEKGQSFATKAEDYMNFGIYRLEQYLKDNPDLSVYATERHFEIDFYGVTLTGSIDRVLYNKVTGEYIIEDIKTKAKLFSDTETETPLQAVIYSYALKNILDLKDYPTTFRYDLPICAQKQPAGKNDYITRGIETIKKTLDAIHSMEIKPSPCPLCYWCPFSHTNPNQPEDGKNLCAYYSMWQPDIKTHYPNHKWEGLENNDRILQEEKERNEQKKVDPLSELDDLF